MTQCFAIIGQTTLKSEISDSPLLLTSVWVYQMAFFNCKALMINNGQIEMFFRWSRDHSKLTLRGKDQQSTSLIKIGIKFNKAKDYNFRAKFLIPIPPDHTFH